RITRNTSSRLRTSASRVTHRAVYNARGTVGSAWFPQEAAHLLVIIEHDLPVSLHVKDLVEFGADIFFGERFCAQFFCHLLPSQQVHQRDIGGRQDVLGCPVGEQWHGHPDTNHLGHGKDGRVERGGTRRDQRRVCLRKDLVGLAKEHFGLRE